MKYLFLALGSLILQTGFGQLTISDPNAEVRNVPAFHAIKISGGIDLLLTKGDVQAVAISNSRTDGNQYIVTTVEKGVLNIHVSSKFKSFSSRRSPKAYVSYTVLDQLIASGACDVKFVDQYNQDRLSIWLAGASKVTGTVRTSRLTVNLTGASEAVLKGSADELKLTGSGASDFKSYDLLTKSCDINLTGASDARISVENMMTVNASGASNLFYKGTPKTSIRSSGASSILQKNE